MGVQFFEQVGCFDARFGKNSASASNLATGRGARGHFRDTDCGEFDMDASNFGHDQLRILR
jgi:hypothetical protein